MIAASYRLLPPRRFGAGRLLLLASLALALVAPASAAAKANPAQMLTYMPTEMVHSIHSAGEVGGFIGELQEYDIGQAALQMPRFTKKGTIKLPESNQQMLRVWSQAIASYNQLHGTDATVTAVFNARLKAKGVDIELPATRAAMIAAIKATVAEGVSGVQLDIEPFPTGPGFLALLEELDATLRHEGFSGRISVVAPGDNWTWSPSYLHAVGTLVDQLNPTFYDTEYATTAAYQELIEEGIAYYSANAPAGAAIVPVIPCYSKDPWHDIAIENVPNATQAVQTALAEGSRVNGVGLWWWYAFYSGTYKHGDAAAERAAWQAQTVNLAYTP